MPHVAWYVSCRRFTVCVYTRDGVIVAAAPVVRKFVGQPLGNLVSWFERFGGLKIHRMKDSAAVPSA